MEREIHVFVCEDELAREIMREYFRNGGINYAAILPAEKRQAVVAAINGIQG